MNWLWAFCAAVYIVIESILGNAAACFVIARFLSDPFSMCVGSRNQETGYWFWVVYTARKLCMVKCGSSFFRRLILNLSSRCLVGELRTFLTLCFKGSYGFLDPSTKSCIKNGNHWRKKPSLHLHYLTPACGEKEETKPFCSVQVWPQLYNRT